MKPEKTMSRREWFLTQTAEEITWYTRQMELAKIKGDHYIWYHGDRYPFSSVVKLIDLCKKEIEVVKADNTYKPWVSTFESTPEQDAQFTPYLNIFKY